MSQSTDQDNTPSSGPYRGRFAPSPTGPLHFGSLIAALASYLEARRHRGDWLVRMEDVDELRNVKGAADQILFSLDAFGFEWDGDVLYQTRRKQAYQQALEALQEQQLVYRCVCSRRDLRATAASGPLGLIYPGTCRHQRHPEHREHALRVRTTDSSIEFNDRIMGGYGQNLAQQLGDFIIRRRDGLFAYQLAVVVDDEFQRITDVVRGHDLLDSTPRQIYLQQCLGYAALSYAHLPLAVNAQGDKLSKQTHAAPLVDKKPVPQLVAAMAFLGQQLEPGLQRASLQTFWQWALENWHISKVAAKAQILYPG